MEGIIAFIIWLLLCYGVGKIAENKGHSGGWVFLVAFVFSPVIGLLIALCLSRRDTTLEGRALRAGQLKKCPECAELVKIEAKKCRFCGYLFEDKITLPERAFFDVARDGEVVGSFTREEIIQRLRSGQLSPQDYYFDLRANDWMQLDIFESAGSMVRM